MKNTRKCHTCTWYSEGYCYYAQPVAIYKENVIEWTRPMVEPVDFCHNYSGGDWRPKEK